jgi:hypothetical protein
MIRSGPVVALPAPAAPRARQGPGVMRGIRIVGVVRARMGAGVGRRQHAGVPLLNEFQFGAQILPAQPRPSSVKLVALEPGLIGLQLLNEASIGVDIGLLVP